MDIRIGPPVSGDNYFPRPRLEQRLNRDLRRNHVSLLAPRRTGKTSLLIRLCDTSPEGEPCSLINLERCLDPATWMVAMLQPLTVPNTRWGEIGQKVKHAIDKLDGIEIPAAGRLKFLKDGWEAPAAQVPKSAPCELLYEPGYASLPTHCHRTACETASLLLPIDDGSD